MRTIRLASHMRHETIDLSKRLVLERNVYLWFRIKKVLMKGLKVLMKRLKVKRRKEMQISFKLYGRVWLKLVNYRKTQ